VSSTLKILDREYSFIPSDKGLNYIFTNEYKEIFIDIFEITCGGNKLIAEKVDTINGDPVIKINTQFEGKEYATLFVVQKGDNHNIILNIKSLGNGRDVYVTEKNIVEEIVKEVEIPQLPKSVTEYTQPAHKSIEVDIEQYKADAIRVIGENFTQKKQKIEQLQESLTSLINERLLKLADSTVVDVDNISKIILDKVDHSIELNRIDKDSTLAEINSIRENILTTVELYNNSFTQTANEKTTQLVELQEKVNFEVNTKLAELDVETKSQLHHITEAYDSIRTFIANTKEEFLNEKTSNAATIEKLFETAKHTVTTNIKRAENLVGKKLSKLQSITDKKINDITSIIESKISYFDEKSQELQTSVDEFNSALSESVQKAINQIAVESQDKLLDFDRTKEEINDLVKSNNVDLQNLKTQFTEAIDKKIKDIKSVAISKEDLNQLKKQIESRFETETANIKKYVASYGGGGGAGSGNQTLSFNEVTAALSISNGNTISLSSLSGGNAIALGNYLPLSGGTVTGDVTVIGTLSTTSLYATNTYLRQDGPTLRFGTSDDVAIGRDGAAETLALGRRNTSPNSLRIYNNYTSATNYERFTIDWQTKPNTCVIATSASSLSGVRGMEFRIGNTTAMSILTSGTIQIGQTIETTAGTLVISKTATPTTGCFDMYANTSATGYPATNDKWFTWSATINGAKTEVLRYYARDATTYILGGANFSIQPAGIFPVAAGGNIDIATGTLRFSQAGNPYVDIAKAGTLDLTIAPTSNITRFGNNTSAQSLYVMNTYTSTANNERFAVDWITKPNTCVIGTSAGSAGGLTRGLDFRVGTNTVVSMASASNNLSFFTDQNNYAGGSRIMFISNATTAPTANPVNGGYMFVSAGELKYRGSAGTITTLAPA